MAILPIYFSTVFNGKRPPKKKTAAQIKAEEEHAKFLKKMGVSGRIRRREHPVETEYTYYRPYHREGPNIQCSDAIPGSAPKKKENVYSGENKLVGIATMHKSSMVPIFEDNKDKAKEIARMRRG